jgi:hypothetical protein
MAGSKVPPSAYLAAAALAVVTLFVFGTLQDYGPESAIRRFHHAIATNNLDELQQVTEQPATSSNVRQIVQTAAIVAQGVPYRIMKMDRSSNEVRAAVVYTLPYGRQAAVVFVVDKEGRSWKIDADKTVTVLKDSLGIR